MRKVLLVEPGYRNKFPPLGLMKISTYHKLKGDNVHFVKGYDQSARTMKWDRIYISTLFTFYWDITIKTIEYYRSSVIDLSDIYVGGVMATLLQKDLEKATGVRVIRGLLNKPGILDDKDKRNIDEVIPDYQILEEIEYDYGLKDSYLAYATRGCPNRCQFCAVNRIEPEFIHYLPIRKQIMGIDEIYGPKQDLILMDNNVLASSNFERIIKDILDLGFQKGAKYNKRMRIVDFNQGTDAELLTEAKMALLAKTAIRPLRIAFDNIGMKNTYIAKIKLAKKYDILNLSNYVLYNYTDTPKDFYDRLRINVLLNEEIGTKIYSFPMKYIPLIAKNRSFVGRHWNKKILRGIQCILLATKGLISPRREFFEAAFGASFEDFLRIAYMPDDYIIYRQNHAANGAYDWQRLYSKLSKSEEAVFLDIISKNKVTREDVVSVSSLKMKKILRHYVDIN